MGLMRDLERWVVWKLRRMGLSDSHIRRLLLDFQVGNLSPILRQALPGEVLEAWPIRGDITGAGLVLLEHGLLILAAAPEFPLTVYTTDELESYLASNGTSIPGVASNEYLIGEAGGTTSVCSSGDVRYQWTTDSGPYQGGSYESVVYETSMEGLFEDPNRLVPSLWTGLAKLWVQVCSGWGRSSLALTAPVEWVPNNESDGIVRLYDATDATYRYWYVRITEASGVQAIELSFNVEGRCALAWLSAHKAGTITLTDNDRRYMEAWVLRSLYIAGDEPTPTTLLNAASIADVYASGAEPLAYGWHYARMRMNTAQEDLAAASIVTCSQEGDVNSSYHACGVHTAPAYVNRQSFPASRPLLARRRCIASTTMSKDCRLRPSLTPPTRLQVCRPNGTCPLTIAAQVPTISLSGCPQDSIRTTSPLAVSACRASTWIARSFAVLEGGFTAISR